MGTLLMLSANPCCEVQCFFESDFVHFSPARYTLPSDIDRMYCLLHTLIKQNKRSIMGVRFSDEGRGTEGIQGNVEPFRCEP